MHALRQQYLNRTLIIRKPLDEMKWKVCSLFSGCGGLDLGFIGGFRFKDTFYEKHDFEIVAAYDVSQYAVQTYKRNIGSHIMQADLTQVPATDMPRHDVLIGGFPCQDFSSCGPKKGLKSERGRLYRVFIEVMKEHKPKVVVAENVPNLARMEKGATLAIILEDLESVGYRFDVWRLSATDYGVPQRRERLFIVGVRSDMEGFPRVPDRITGNVSPTIDWAIGDLVDVDGSAVPNHEQFFKAGRAKRGNGQGDEVNRPGEPSYTIRANAKSRVQFHYSLNRRLTVRECARLQTFPDNFVFPFSATTNVLLIGNAVPPVLAHGVAGSISKYLANFRREPGLVETEEAK